MTEKDLHEERLNFEGALELCHQVGLPTADADDLDSLVVQVRSTLEEMHTANERTLEALQEARHERDMLAAAVRDLDLLHPDGLDRRVVRRNHATALALAAQIRSEKPDAPAKET